MLRAVAAIALIGSSGLPACSDSCTPMSVSGIAVRLRDAQGRSVCGAVTVTSGNFSEELVENGRKEFDCRYSGLRDRGGRYAVTASAPGYKTVQTNVEIETDRCGVQPATLTLQLERE